MPTQTSFPVPPQGPAPEGLLPLREDLGPLQVSMQISDLGVVQTMDGNSNQAAPGSSRGSSRPPLLLPVRTGF